ncbi:MAG: hypothetical protein ACOY5Y_00775 [Pseudomonadota bacterium]
MTSRSTPSPLSQWAVTTLAYAVAVALTALCLAPTILAPLPLSVLAPEPQAVVARTPLAETAP